MSPPVTERPARIVFLDRATFPEAVALRPFSFPHTLAVHAATAPGDVAARIADADIVITNKVPVRAEAIAAAPRLAMVAVAATGYDIVDVAACAARGITVSNIRNYAVHTVPEHTFALILSLRAQHRTLPAVGGRGRLAASPGSSATSTTRSAGSRARRSA